MHPLTVVKTFTLRQKTLAVISECPLYFSCIGCLSLLASLCFKRVICQQLPVFLQLFLCAPGGDFCKQACKLM